MAGQPAREPAIAVSPHEEAGRWRKVARLIAALYVHEFDVHTACKLNDDEWHIVAMAAQVHPPSKETIQLVLQTLENVDGQ